MRETFLTEMIINQDYYIVQEVYSRNNIKLKNNNFLGTLEKIDINERENAFIHHLTFKLKPTETSSTYRQQNTNIIFLRPPRSDNMFIRLRIIVLKGRKPNNVNDIIYQSNYSWFDKVLTQNNEIIGQTYIQSDNISQLSSYQKIKFYKFNNTHSMAVFMSKYNNLPESLFGNIGKYVGSNSDAIQKVINFQQRRTPFERPSKIRKTKGGKRRKRRTKKRKNIKKSKSKK